MRSRMSSVRSGRSSVRCWCWCCCCSGRRRSTTTRGSSSTGCSRIARRCATASILSQRARYRDIDQTMPAAVRRERIRRRLPVPCFHRYCRSPHRLPLAARATAAAAAAVAPWGRGTTARPKSRKRRCGSGVRSIVSRRCCSVR